MVKLSSRSDLTGRPFNIGTVHTYMQRKLYLCSHTNTVTHTHASIALPLHCNENPIGVFLFWELRGLSPNFHIHVSMSDLYIPWIGPIFPAAEQADRSWEYINRLQTHECGNWDCGRAIPFLEYLFQIFGIGWFFAVCSVASTIS